MTKVIELKVSMRYAPTLNEHTYEEDRFLSVKVTGDGKQYGTWIRAGENVEAWLGRVSESLKAVVEETAREMYKEFNNGESTDE